MKTIAVAALFCTQGSVVTNPPCVPSAASFRQPGPAQHLDVEAIAGIHRVMRESIERIEVDSWDTTVSQPNPVKDDARRQDYIAEATLAFQEDLSKLKNPAEIADRTRRHEERLNTIEETLTITELNRRTTRDLRVIADVKTRRHAEFAIDRRDTARLALVHGLGQMQSKVSTLSRSTTVVRNELYRAELFSGSDQLAFVTSGPAFPEGETWLSLGILPGHFFDAANTVTLKPMVEASDDEVTLTVSRNDAAIYTAVLRADLGYRLSELRSYRDGKVISELSLGHWIVAGKLQAPYESKLRVAVDGVESGFVHVRRVRSIRINEDVQFDERAFHLPRGVRLQDERGDRGVPVLIAER